MSVVVTLAACLMFLCVVQGRDLLNPDKITMSTTLQSYTGQYCGDGKIDNSFCHTISGPQNTWLQFDFGREVTVQDVAIVNRDICQQRLFCDPVIISSSSNCNAREQKCGPCTSANASTCGFEVRVGNKGCHTVLDKCDENPVCFSGDVRDSDRRMIQKDCTKLLVGRYLQVVLPGEDRLLNLAEVQVHGSLVVGTTTVSTSTATTTTNTQFQILSKNIGDIELKILEDLAGKVSALEDANDDLSKRLVEAERVNSEQQSTITALKSQYDNDITNLNDLVSNLRNRLDVGVNGDSSVTLPPSDEEKKCSSCESEMIRDGNNVRLSGCCGDVIIESQSCAVNPCDTQKKLDALVKALAGDDV